MMSERQASDGRTRGEMALEMKKPPVSGDSTMLGIERRTERMLDSYEAAPILRIHPKTLQRMARNGEIRAAHVGKLWRFRSSDIELWIATKLAS